MIQLAHENTKPRSKGGALHAIIRLTNSSGKIMKRLLVLVSILPIISFAQDYPWWGGIALVG